MKACSRSTHRMSVHAFTDCTRPPLSALTLLSPLPSQAESQSKLLDLFASLNATASAVTEAMLQAVPALPKLVKRLRAASTNAAVKSAGTKLVRQWMLASSSSSSCGTARDTAANADSMGSLSKPLPEETVPVPVKLPGTSQPASEPALSAPRQKVLTLLIQAGMKHVIPVRVSAGNPVADTCGTY